MQRSWIANFAVCCLLALGIGAHVTGCTTRVATTTEDARSEDATQLHALLDEAHEYESREDSETNSTGKDTTYTELFSVVTMEERKRDARKWRALLDRLTEVDRAALDRTERIYYDLFERELQDRITDFEHKTYLTPISHEGGFYTWFARRSSRTSPSDVDEYENYIARLRAFPDYMQYQIGLLRQGIETGHTLPGVVLKGIGASIESYIAEEAEQSPFYEPFSSFPESISQSERTRLRNAGREAIRDDVVPAYRTFQSFMEEEYLPNARKSIGVSARPDGRKYYEKLVRYYTTLDVTPEEIHKIGLGEVARIRAEMETVIDETGFEGSFEEFLEFLRTDSQFYAETPDELLRRASRIAKQVDGTLPSLFHLRTLPRRSYGVEPVPADIAPDYTGGRYVPASQETDAGTYWVNTYDLDSRPLYVLPALTMHEAVPGHHLQIALEQESDDRPPFLESASVAAYSEGWALYSEWLGLEAGLYSDPYKNFGRLTYEMWRACRLVVDTGIHAMGWSRERAMNYLASNTALSLHEVRTETDRYIAVPGQALAYKMGELQIRELRQKAEDSLGSEFDVRDFHEVVLQSGPVPLNILENHVDRYIEKETTKYEEAP